VKTTLMFRQIANPRRTTLAHLTDASELDAGRAGAVAGAQTGSAAEADTEGAVGTGTQGRVLPERTANPRRTVLTELPKAPVAP